MAEGRIEQAWNHTAALLTVLINVNRDPRRGRPAKPTDFHPMAKRNVAQAPPLKAEIGLLKTVFVDNPCSAGRSSP